MSSFKTNIKPLIPENTIGIENYESMVRMYYTVKPQIKKKTWNKKYQILTDLKLYGV